MITILIREMNFYMMHEVLISINGVSKSPQDWADSLGISVSSFFMRLQEGRNVDELMYGQLENSKNVPKIKTVQRDGRNVMVLTLKGETKTLKEWCDTIGIGMTSLRYRLDKGFSEEEILKPRSATNRKGLPILQEKEKETGSKKAVNKKNDVLSSEKESKIETVTLLGTKLPIKKWADTIGITVGALEYRVNQGWSEQEILYGKTNEKPVVQVNRNKIAPVNASSRDSKMDKEVCFEGEIKSLREWSVELGISEHVIRGRMSKGKLGRELLLPVKEIEARIEVKIGDRKFSFRQLSQRTGISEDILRRRYNQGYRGEKLINLQAKEAN